MPSKNSYNYNKNEQTVRDTTQVVPQYMVQTGTPLMCNAGFMEVFTWGAAEGSGIGQGNDSSHTARLRTSFSLVLD